MSKSASFSLALLLALVPGHLAAQAVSGTVLGIVKDASGAAVVNAKVVIASAETGVTRTVLTNAGGDYEAPSLPPGVYSVSVEMSGFKKTALAGLQLGIDQKLRADV